MNGLVIVTTRRQRSPRSSLTSTDAELSKPPSGQYAYHWCLPLSVGIGTFAGSFSLTQNVSGGGQFNTVALVVLVFQLTGSGLGVAATVVFEVAPILLLGPAAGVVADRYRGVG